MSVFGERLKKLIKENNTSIQAVADNISRVSAKKITRQAVSQYADGTTMPNAERIYYIAQYFGVSADYLLGITDVAYPEYAIDVDGFLKKCKESADTVRKCLDKLMNNDKIFDYQAYAFFETKLRMYEYDIPGLVEEYLKKRRD